MESCIYVIIILVYWIIIYLANMRLDYILLILLIITIHWYHCLLFFINLLEFYLLYHILVNIHWNYMSLSY